MTGPYDSVIVRCLCRVLVPFIQVYGLYVVAHGHYSPGGGFQGGVILGAGFILLLIAEGKEGLPRRLLARGLTAWASSGLLLYSGIGAVSLLAGGSFLDYGFLPLPLEPAARVRALGILGIEMAVGLGVMAIMVILFASISSYGEEGEDSGVPGQQV